MYQCLKRLLKCKIKYTHLLKPKEETLSEGSAPVVILRWIWSRWAVVNMSHTW